MTNITRVPEDSGKPTQETPDTQEVETILADMDANAVHAGDVNDSREAIYTRLNNE